MSSKRVLVFGTGRFFENRKQCIPMECVIGFLDNNPDKQGKMFCGRKVISPEQISQEKFDYVLIMSSAENDMKQQLLELGINDEKIVFFDELYKIKKEMESMVFYSAINNYNLESPIVLVSHELSYTGGPIVLKNLAVTLKKMGYFPVIISPADGPLRNDIVDNDLMLIVDANITKRNPLFYQMFHFAKMVIVNTVVAGNVISEFADITRKMVWWLHEGDMSYNEHTIKYCGLKTNNLYVYAVSSLAANSYKKYGDRLTGIMHYGLDDYYDTNLPDIPKDKIIFAVIGTVGRRKGQDILAEAVKKLNDDIRNKAEFWVVGKTLEDEVEQILRADETGTIKIFGEIPSEEIPNLYRQIDVVVCPSREDPLPVVLSEGMMNHKVCIMSDMTGTADLVDDMVNGLVFKSESADELAGKITWIVENWNSEKVVSIKDNSRTLFETQFSNAALEKKIKEIIELA